MILLPSHHISSHVFSQSKNEHTINIVYNKHMLNKYSIVSSQHYLIRNMPNIIVHLPTLKLNSFQCGIPNSHPLKNNYWSIWLIRNVGHLSTVDGGESTQVVIHLLCTLKKLIPISIYMICSACMMRLIRTLWYVHGPQNVWPDAHAWKEVKPNDVILCIVYYDWLILACDCVLYKEIGQ